MVLACYAPALHAQGGAKTGVAAWSFRLFSLEAALDKADSAGVKYLEAFEGQPLQNGAGNTFSPAMPADSILWLKELLLQKKIQMRSAYLASPSAKEEWEHVFRFARALGLSYITAEPLPQHFDLLDRLGAQYQIKVALHNHPRGSSRFWHPDSVLLALQGRPWLGVCADVGHWARSGINITAALRQLEGRIIALHVKDIDALGALDAADVPAGAGAIDFSAVCREMKRQKFKGYYIIEREGNWENNVTDVKGGVKMLRKKGR
jgi:sugar phosphate isomerase/epimerase